MSEGPATSSYHAARWTSNAERISSALGDWTQLIGAPPQLMGLSGPATDKTNSVDDVVDSRRGAYPNNAR
jgi:hypothetical protein